jgi:hypothetical protein
LLKFPESSHPLPVNEIAGANWTTGAQRIAGVVAWRLHGEGRNAYINLQIVQQTSARLNGGGTDVFHISAAIAINAHAVVECAAPAPL